MKKKSRVSLLLTVFLLSLTLLGCTSGSPDAALTPEQILQTALTNSAAIQSYDADMTMGMSFTMLGQSMNMTTTATMTAFSSPMKIKMLQTIDMGLADFPTQEMEYYIAEADGKLMMYTNMDGQWQAEEMPIGDLEALKQYDAQANMEFYLQSMQNFTQTGSEEINGKSTTIFEGIISGDAMREAVETSGMLDSISDSTDAADLESLFAGLSDMPVQVWIETDSYIPVKYSLDMTQIITKVMENAMQMQADTTPEISGMDLSVTVEEAKMDMTLKNLNQAVDFEIPQEALDAAPAV